MCNYFIHTVDKQNKVKLFIVIANNKEQAIERIKKSASINYTDEILINETVPLTWEYKQATILFA